MIHFGSYLMISFGSRGFFDYGRADPRRTRPAWLVANGTRRAGGAFPANCKTSGDRKGTARVCRGSRQTKGGTRVRWGRVHRRKWRGAGCTLEKAAQKIVKMNGLPRGQCGRLANRRSRRYGSQNPLSHSRHQFAQAASLTFLAEYERTPSCIEAVGALNRWPGHSALPIGDYLRQWQASCAELQASPLLPTRLREMLGIG
jgi:hypothetical protein